MKKYIAGVLVLATFIIGGQTAHASFFKDVWGGLKTVIKGNQQGLGASARGATTTDTLIGDTVLTQDTFSIPESSTLPIKIPTASTPTKKITPSIEGTPINTVVPAPVKIAAPQNVTPPVENIKQQIEAAPSVVKNTPSSIDLSKNNIFDIQNILKEQGFFTVTPNGSFGPKTKEAVKKFQEANGLEKTGVVDIATSTMLKGGSVNLGDETIGTFDPINGQLFKQCSITSLSAAPAVINSGAASTIAWKTAGCRSATLDGSAVTVLSGTKATGALTATKTFTLVAVGSNNTATKSVTVVVKTVPTITVTAPNTGESYVDGQQVTVTWNAANIPTNGTFACELYVYDTNNALLGVVTLTGPVPNSGRQWTVNLPTLSSMRSGWPALKNASFGNHFKMRVYANNTTSEIASDLSDNFFSIYNPITVTSPNGNEVYTGGQPVTVTWTNTSAVAGANVTAFLQVADTAGTGVLNTMYLLRDAAGGSSTPVSQGNTTFTLPTIAQIKARAGLTTTTAGKYFKIGLFTDIGPISPSWVWNDASDGFFTIQDTSSATVTPSINIAATTIDPYVLGGVPDASQVMLNFTAAGGTAVVTELKFTASGTSNAATSIKVGSVTAPFVGGVAWLQGLNIAVPAGAAGVNIQALVTYAPAGSIGVPSGSPVTVGLSYFKYTSGSNTIIPVFTPLTAPTLTIVGSKPSVSVGSVSGAPLVVGSNNAIDVAITANAAGSIAINKMPILVTVNKAVLGSGSAIVVKDQSNTIVPTTSTVFASGASTITFTGGHTIAAGQSKTFKIYVPVSTITGTGSNSASIGTSLPTTGFKWTDIAGSGTVSALGTPWVYPTGTVYIHN